MEQTFESILSSLLKYVEEHPEKDIDQLLAEKLAEIGVTKECIDEVALTSEVIDGFETKYNSLEAAKEDEKSRTKWLMEQFDESLEGIDDDTKVEVLNAVGECVENKTNELFNQ